MASPVLLGSVLRSQSRAEQAYSWGDHALVGYLEDVVDDTTPQLGGNLDVNGFDITSATNGDIDIYPHGSGTLTLGGTGSGGTVLTAGVGAVSITTLSDNADITLDPHGTGDIILSANVGIGTASPSRLLHIVDTSSGPCSPALTPVVASTQVVLEGAGGNSVLTLGVDATYKAQIFAQVGGETYPFTRIRSDSVDNALTFATGDGATNLTEWMRIAADGKVGIGTSAPSTNLHVAEDASAGDVVVVTLDAETTYGGRIVLNSNQCANEWQINWGTGSTDRFQITQLSSGGGEFEINPMSGGAGGAVKLGCAQTVLTNAAASLEILERATGPSGTATYGKLWVKNTTPCELWFTDDAGTATKIV